MSETFIKDTRGNSYSLKPIIVIDGSSSSPLYISTHSMTLKDVDQPIYNILKDVPRIRETLDIEKSSIKNHHLVFTFYNYGKKIEGFNTVSELFGSRKFINKRVDLYFLSQSANSIEDASKIFSGVVKKGKHSSDFFQLEAESLAGEIFSTQVPSRNSQFTIDHWPLARKQVVDKFRPIVFGEVDYAPAYNYGDKIYTSSPDFSHGSLVDKFVKMGTSEYAATPIAVYQGGYWVLAPGFMSFQPSNTGMKAVFNNAYYEPSKHQPGGDHYSDYSQGKFIKLELTDVPFKIIVTRKPLSVTTSSKADVINWRIVRDHQDENYEVVESERDWHSLDLNSGIGTVQTNSIEQYFRHNVDQTQDMPETMQNLILDLQNDSWVQMKGITYLPNSNYHQNGMGKFDDDFNWTQIIFNFKPLSEFIPDSFEIIRASQYNCLLTKVEVDGSADLPITTEHDVTVGYIEYSAGDDLIYQAPTDLQITIQGSVDREEGLHVNEYDITEKADVQGVYKSFPISEGSNNSQSFDNVFSDGEVLNHAQYNAEPLPDTDKVVFGVAPQWSVASQNHNGWLGHSTTSPTPYSNVRFNIEAKIYGAEMISQFQVHASELDLFSSVRGVRINQYTFYTNLQNLHFNESDVNDLALQSHPAIINGHILKAYSNLSVKLTGENSLQSAVDYSVSNWTNSYNDLPQAAKTIIDNIVQKDEWYRTKEDEEFRLDFFIDEKTDVQGVFDDISQSTNSIPYLSPGEKDKLQFITISEKYDDNSIAHFKNENGEYVKHKDLATHLKKSHILNYSFELSKSENVYNSVDVDFGFDAATRSYRYNFKLNANSFISGYDMNYYKSNPDETKTKKLELRKFKRSESAVRYATYYLMDRCNRHLECELDLPVKYIYLQIGDLIVFDELLDNKPYNIDYTTDYDQSTQMQITVNKQKVFKYFLITEVSKSLNKVTIKARQMHDLAPFKDSGVVGCNDQEGDIVNGLLCIKTPDNYEADVNVSNSSVCNHVVGCADEQASNYAVDGDGDPIDANGNKITLHNPVLCEYVIEEEIEEEEENTGETDEDNDVDDPTDEAEDDTEEPSYGSYYVYDSKKSVFKPFFVYPNQELNYFSFTKYTYTSTPEGQKNLINMLKLELSLKYRNTSDNYSIEDLFKGDDTLTNTADSESFKIIYKDGHDAYDDMSGGYDDKLFISIKKRNGELIDIRDLQAEDFDGSEDLRKFFCEDLFELVSSTETVIDDNGSEVLIGHVALHQKTAIDFHADYSYSEISHWVERLTGRGILHDNMQIKYQLDFAFQTDDFVDEFGNSVEAVSMNDSNWDSLHWEYKTDLVHYDVSEFGEIAMGDVNNDATVNVLDLVSIAGYILGTVDYNEAQSIASDVNFDETTNILDMVSIVQYILGIITYDTLHANYIWRFFLEHVNGVIMGTQDSITPTNPTVGFKAFVRSGADARIYFIPSPDGEVLFDETQHQNILDALNSKDWNTIMTAIGSTPIQSMLEVLTPVSYNYQNQTIEDNEYPQGTIRTIKNTLTFNGNGNYNYLFAIAIIKNDDNSAEVKWKEYEILT